MGKVIAVSNNKGGVLKTSITTNLAGVLARDKRVLIVDTDNQGNCLLSFGRNPDLQEHTIYDVLVGNVAAEKAVVSVYENIDVLPANDDMSFFELDVLSNAEKYPKPFYLLRERLAEIRDHYHYILVDTPPTLGLTQANVLCFADQVLIPFQPETYSMRSLVKMTAAIQDFHDQHNPGLSVLGVVATLVDPRTSLHSDVLQESRAYCDKAGIPMFETVIPRTVRFASSVAYDRLPATLSDPKHQTAQHYLKLFEEVEARG